MTPAALMRANALHLPLAGESVDLIVTSPPYFALRSYRDAGEHYDGQIGSEPTPQAFLEALWSVMAECWRVLKPTGVCFVNLGDKRVNYQGAKYGKPQSMNGHDRNEPTTGPSGAPAAWSMGRPKSKLLLPHRFAIGCEDGMADPEGKGWIVRQDMVWSKPNSLPESVTDRTRDSHEFWFMLVKEGRYYSAMDEIREPHTGGANPGRRDGAAPPGGHLDRLVASGDRAGAIGATNPAMFDPRGKMPGSVWSVPSEPLTVPDEVRARLDLPDHFAAFPSEWPRRLILGWSPSGICAECGEGRRPTVEKRRTTYYGAGLYRNGTQQVADGAAERGFAQDEKWTTSTAITGEACLCPSPAAPTRPAVVLDPFGGTGTTAAVARAAGRLGVSVDLSADYLRLARWRIEESGDGERAIFGARPPRQIAGQLGLLA